VKELVMQWLALAGLENNESAYVAMVLALILLISLLVHFVLHNLVFRALARSRGGSRNLWQEALVEHGLFKRLAFTLQGIILYTQTRIWLDADAVVRPFIQVLTLEWILLYAFLSIYSLITAIELAASRTTVGQSLPLRGLAQSFKLLAAGIALILGLSLLIGKSPLILFSGLGAMTAVLLLVFKDPLLGLVAGVQLSANNMLKVGDWLEMPKYGADGDVIDISLTTVKVQNWDKTITTIPSYALIADSFKNWRGMSDAGGRRIKRAFNLDVSSVHFMDEDEIQRLRGLQLIAAYIENKISEIEADNKARNIDPSSPANGRRLTNIGTLRAYLTQYLKANANIHPDMTTMVRQLAPGPEGIPLEIYCFSKNTAWVDYEGIQADIFDHILAVVPEFNLRIHQSPNGHDMRQIGRSASNGS
jgi:miniconductance mechanosensitive channel